MHPALEAEMKKRWNQVSANHSLLHIAEFSEADWVAGRTTGDPTNCWTWDGSDLQDVGTDTRHTIKAKAGGVLEHAGMRFCFDPENEGMVLVEFVTGVLAGSGEMMKLSEDGESLRPVPEGQKWKF
ncbi:MAG: hypothetical protein HUU15_14645 [Candidatus Brocadiae bacterium]|nr:hypothetical protein [Candidatus Brocadiia bacterium]